MKLSLILFVSVLVVIIGISDAKRISSQENIVKTSPLVQDLIKGDTLWDACVNVPVLGDSCVEVYTILPNLTLGISLTIGNTTYINLPLIEGKAFYARM
jgi:hypothetical protein